jgi:hypothetical protein
VAFTLRLGVALAVAWTVARTSASQVPAGHTFESDRPGGPPAAFVFASMRQETPGTWLIRRDGDNSTLVHTSNAPAGGYGLALAPDAPLRDVQAAVRMRLAGGTRAGGLVWRYIDAANFYATVLDLSKGELVLFRVVDGNRIFLESEDGLELDAAAWHTLKIVHDDSRVVVSLGGIRVFEERDRRSGRGSAGGTGLIAAGGAEVWFDDLRIELDRDRRR